MTNAAEKPAKELADGEGLVELLVKHHLGSPPKSVESKSGGLNNQVFMVEHKEGSFVVRLSAIPDRINAYLKEQWAVQHAREAGVPAPEILQVGNDIIEHPYMIARRVDGEDATNHPNRIEVIRSVGHMARLLHTVKTSGFGETFDWTRNQLSKNETWQEFVENELNLSDRIEVLRKHKMLGDDRIEEIERLLRDEGLGGKPSLNHGDLRLKNIMALENGDITAIIDWEMCTSNLTPHWEFSLALHDLSVDEKEAFIQGYGISSEELLEMSPVIRAINIVNYVPEIQMLSSQKDKSRLDELRMRLSGALDLY